MLWNENKQQGFTNNLKRANQAFLPASTFKIPNSLIALDLGVVKDEHQVFKKSQGVVVLWNENKQQGFTNNLKRANQAFLPASTFKIPNSLIALDLGVVKDEHQVFK
ncbi:penicillin-binding transpeptidase domain-containing protein, partial [Escherichia coli]|uniref:penicillin-binding transpeptidase domain-containing protein n=1 Tax=Escherichia coli TaxID=562 RepID=UPI003F4DEE30